MWRDENEDSGQWSQTVVFGCVPLADGHGENGGLAGHFQR